MSELNKVVVHYMDGRIVKGTTQDFHPNRPSFHILPPDGGSAVEIQCRQLKAVFFVRDFKGDSGRRDVCGYLAGPEETSQGKKLAVRFKDGELLCGYSLAYTRERDGFFMSPADAGSNNLRIYVMSTGAVDVKAGPAADMLVQKVLDTKAA